MPGLFSPYCWAGSAGAWGFLPHLPDDLGWGGNWPIESGPFLERRSNDSWAKHILGQPSPIFVDCNFPGQHSDFFVFFVWCHKTSKCWCLKSRSRWTYFLTFEAATKNANMFSEQFFLGATYSYHPEFTMEGTKIGRLFYLSVFFFRRKKPIPQNKFVQFNPSAGMYFFQSK